MGTPLNEGTYKHDFLKFELDANYSREAQTVVAAAAAGLKKGTVLGIKTADGKYYPSVSGAADGTQTAVAVLYDDIPQAATGAAATVIVRGAMFLAGGLVWDASYDTDPKKLVATNSLRGLGMPVVAK